MHDRKIIFLEKELFHKVSGIHNELIVIPVQPYLWDLDNYFFNNNPCF